MVQKSQLRLRFVFNQRSRKLADAQETKTVATAIVENVAYNYRQGMHNKLNGEIRRRLIQDMDREMTYVVGEFRRSMIGIDGFNAGVIPRDLDTVAPAARAFGPETSAKAKTDWMKRSPEYMRWKQQQGYGTAWFRNKGQVLREMQYRAAWTQYFGPIRVKITPSHQRAPKENMIGPRTYGHLKLKVANIAVEAMSHITPSMLPALSNPRGSINQVGNHDRLMKLLPKPIGVRLGAGRSYRPGLEPFLSFVLTRSIPNALFKRIEVGFKTRTIRQTTSRA